MPSRAGRRCGSRRPVRAGRGAGRGVGARPQEIWCMQREPGALRPGDRPGVSRHVCACASGKRCPFAVVGVARSDGQLVLAPGSDDASAKTVPSTCRWRYSSASPADDRDVTRVRGRNRRWTCPASTSARLPTPSCATVRCVQTVPDHHRGPLGRRAQSPRPARRPVAGARLRRRSHLTDFTGLAGQAMSSGERTPLAAVDAPASGRMAVGEALTNLLAARWS